MNITLESLGLTNEDIAQRLIDSMCEKLLNDKMFDEDGDYAGTRASAFRERLNKKIEAKIDETITALAQAVVLPKVVEYIETMTIQKTNRYGEKQGKAFTFTEYMAKQAEDYLLEKVDDAGKPKGEREYGWKESQTRLTFLINEQLHPQIKKSVSEAFLGLQKTAAAGLMETIRTKINEAAAQVSVTIKPG